MDQQKKCKDERKAANHFGVSSRLHRCRSHTCARRLKLYRRSMQLDFPPTCGRGQYLFSTVEILGCHSEPREESLITALTAPPSLKPEMFRSVQHDTSVLG